MRIAAINSPQGKIFGIVQDDNFRPFLIGRASVRDLRHVIKLLGEGTPPETGEPVALKSVKLAAPVGPLAKNVICVGKNYHDHAREFARSGVDQSGDKQEVPADPVIFTKSTSALADPFQKIAASSDPTGTVDYEGELGVVIGKRGKNVKRVDALDCVFAYTIVNDVTARAVAAPQAMVSRQSQAVSVNRPWRRDEFQCPMPRACHICEWGTPAIREAARHDFRRADIYRDGHVLCHAGAG
jgi:2-keto-4-pentenoate hydratase/2-oxohepta-3-ene-1,7-dioic acid hydratase in catechol pathway